MIQARLPADLQVQEFDGYAWVAIVPFLMVDMMKGAWPSVYPLHRFPELNVRTYVERKGRPGVWFFSLDADCTPLVLGARFLYGLPYFKARMSHRENGGRIEFRSQRVGASVHFQGSYRPVGPQRVAQQGSFEHWVAERYCLYSCHKGCTISLDVHHRPWPLQDAEVRIDDSNLLDSLDLPLLDGTAVCHYSKGVEVISYSPNRANQSLDPTSFSVTDRADARSAPEKDVGQH